MRRHRELFVPLWQSADGRGPLVDLRSEAWSRGPEKNFELRVCRSLQKLDARCAMVQALYSVRTKRCMYNFPLPSFFLHSFLARDLEIPTSKIEAADGGGWGWPRGTRDAGASRGCRERIGKGYDG